MTPPVFGIYVKAGSGLHAEPIRFPISKSKLSQLHVHIDKPRQFLQIEQQIPCKIEAQNVYLSFQ